MVEAMKPGSVIVDLAAERGGGNCKMTVADEKIVTANGVTIIGYTDFPSHGDAGIDLYATNIRHMLTDLTPEKDGVIVLDMEDDVIRGATVTFEGDITFPPPPPKVQAIASKTKSRRKKHLKKSLPRKLRPLKAGRQQTR